MHYNINLYTALTVDLQVVEVDIMTALTTVMGVTVVSKKKIKCLQGSCMASC